MAIRSSVTISLVPEARGGPFVFWDDLDAACAKVAALGFDAVEIFPRDPAALDAQHVRTLLDSHGLKLAAMGTGAGWLRHKLTLTSGDDSVRSRARDFIKTVIDLAGSFGAPAIIGSMQGRSGDGVDHETAIGHLRDALDDLGRHAASGGVPLIYEPLNRYETNLTNTVAGGVALLDGVGDSNVVLLADLFHMNIEEQDLAAAIRAGKGRIGHVHFVDSNRRPAGFGHIDFAPIADALRDIGYDGYASAEALPHPDPDAAAEATMAAYRRFFVQGS